MTCTVGMVSQQTMPLCPPSPFQYHFFFCGPWFTACSHKTHKKVRCLLLQGCDKKCCETGRAWVNLQQSFKFLGMSMLAVPPCDSQTQQPPLNGKSLAGGLAGGEGGEEVAAFFDESINIGTNHLVLTEHGSSTSFLLTGVTAGCRIPRFVFRSGRVKTWVPEGSKS